MSRVLTLPKQQQDLQYTCTDDCYHPPGTLNTTKWTSLKKRFRKVQLESNLFSGTPITFKHHSCSLKKPLLQIHQTYKKPSRKHLFIAWNLVRNRSSLELHLKLTRVFRKGAERFAKKAHNFFLLRNLYFEFFSSSKRVPFKKQGI